MDNVCTRETRTYDIIGEVCPECGHNMVLHGGVGNPAIDRCMMCELAERMRSALGPYIS